MDTNSPVTFEFGEVAKVETRISYLSIAQEPNDVCEYEAGAILLGKNPCLSPSPLALVVGFSQFCRYRRNGRPQGEIVCHSFGLGKPSMRAREPQSDLCRTCPRLKWDDATRTRGATSGVEMWVYLLDEKTYARYQPTPSSMREVRSFARRIQEGTMLASQGRLPYVRLESQWVVSDSGEYAKIKLVGGWGKVLDESHQGLIRQGQGFLADAIARNDEKPEGETEDGIGETDTF